MPPLIKVLDRILDYHLQHNRKVSSCLQTGLTRDEIDELLKDIPYTIPEELYQLYGWRNGMNRKGVQNYGFLIFADSKGFLPLEEVIKTYKYMITSPFTAPDKYPKNKLCVFPPATDTTAAYTIDLGEENFARVCNYDDEYNDYSAKYGSILSMMSTYITDK